MRRINPDVISKTLNRILTWRGTNITDDTRAYALARRTTQQAISSGAFTVINFDTVDSDTRSAVTTGAAWKYTAPAGHGGIYQVNATVCLAAGTSAILALGLFKNGTEHRRLARLPASASAMTVSPGSMVQLAAGDYIDLRIYHDAGVNRNINEGAGATRDVQCQVEIVRLVTDL